MFSDLMMYVYLVFAILNIYGVVGNVTPPSVFKAIEISSHDTNYKCPLLRASKLFANVSDILSSCPNFMIAQSLKKVDTNNVDNGLCILYYNNFENLCYLSNNASADSLKLENAVPSHFENDINVVCKTLIVNTHIVKNAQPGIDAITQRLVQNDMCARLCTDLDGKVKPICSLSAYITSITALIENVNKEQTVNSSAKVEKMNSSNITLNKELPQEDAPQLDANANKMKDAEIAFVTNATAKGLSTPDLKKSAISDIPHIENAALSSTTSVTKSDKPEGHIELKPDDVVISKVGRDSQVQMAPTVEKHGDDNVAADPINAPVQQITGGTLDRPLENQNENTNSQGKEQAINLNKPPESNINPVSKSDGLHASPVEKGEVKTTNKANEEPPGNVGKGDTVLNTKEEDDDIEIEEGMAPVGDPNMDYGSEVAPKYSEVRAKADVIISTEKLKPLQTDEERLSISANYQNQNVDDSDSYFFSYFMMFCIIFICGYVAYHNKQKILALVVEGRRSRRPSRTRRPNSANYRKLDSNLEEAVTSTCNKNAPQVIY